MYFDDSAPYFPYGEDSHARRPASRTSHSTQRCTSPKDSTRFNDYDWSILLAAVGSTPDSRVQTNGSLNTDDSNVVPEDDTVNVSVGFDSYIKAFAKPAQMQPALPAPPTGVHAAAKPTKGEKGGGGAAFDFGPQSFLRTVEPSDTRSSSSTRDATSSARNRARTHPSRLSSPIELLELSGNSASTQRRSAGSRSSSTLGEYPRRDEDATLLDHFLGSTPVTTAASASSPNASVPLHPPRTTRATPLVMGAGYLDSFLDHTSDATVGRSGRRTTSATRRLPLTSPTRTETEPYTPFLDAADSEARALTNDSLISSVRVHERDVGNRRPATNADATETQKADGARQRTTRASTTVPVPVDLDPPLSSTRRTSKGPVSAASSAAATPALQTLDSDQLHMRDHSPSAVSKLDTPSTAHPPAPPHASETPTVPTERSQVMAMIADHPVTSATRSSPAVPIVLLPPLSPTLGTPLTRCKLSDDSNASALSEHSWTRTQGESSSRGGSLPALTPPTSSGGMISPGTMSTVLDTHNHSDMGSTPAHRRMARPRPSGTYKGQQAMAAVALPPLTATSLNATAQASISTSSRHRDGNSEMKAPLPPAPSAAQKSDSTSNTPRTTTPAPTPPPPALPSSTPQVMSGASNLSKAATSIIAGRELPAAWTAGPRASSFSGLSCSSGTASQGNVTALPSATSARSGASRTGSRASLVKSPLRKGPFPLQAAPSSILVRARVFDPKAVRDGSARRRRPPPRRSLPNGKRRANWVPPPTSYAATLHEWCGDMDDEEDDEDEGGSEDIAIDAPPSVTSSVRQSYPGAIMVDEVDKKRLIASEEGTLLSPFARNGLLSPGQTCARDASLEDVVRVSRSFDGSTTPLSPSFFKANSSVGSDGSPPPSRSSRRTQTPLTRPSASPLDLAAEGAFGGSSHPLFSLPRVTFDPTMEEIPF